MLLVAGLVRSSFFRLFVEFADCDLESLGLAVTENAEVDVGSRRHLTDGHLQGAAVDDFLAVEVTKPFSFPSPHCAWVALQLWPGAPGC